MITNTSNKKVISKKYKTLNSVLSKSIGLMFSRKSKLKDNSLVFSFKKPTKASFHMFFVFYPIDLVLLDNSNKVVEIKENFKPFTLYFPKKTYSRALELPEGTIERVDLFLNNQIAFK
ncbi:DUF192 domain-containing protein [Nanoarchaeota archaeon]